MANSITGINDDIIAMSALESFTAAGTPLRAFSTNFSDEAAKRGATISVPRMTTADAAATKSTHTAYTIQDADSDAVEITLGEPQYVAWGLDDVEIASASVLSMELYGHQKGFQLMKAVLQDIWADVTAANFATVAFTGAAGTFDPGDVNTIAESCDTNDMPEDMRSLILSPSYYHALFESTQITDASAFGNADAIQRSVIRQLHGFSVYKSNLIPSNSENLVGMAVHPAALAVAVRYLQPQEGNKYNRAEALTDPETGLTIGLRDWYDENEGVRKRVLECVQGSITGIAAGLQRLKSA